MLTLEMNNTYKCLYTASGVKKSGESFLVVAFGENDQLPEGKEKRSRQKLGKLWNPEVIEGEVKKGCNIEIVSFTGASLYFESDTKTDSNGEVVATYWTPVMELLNAKIRVVG